MIRSFFKDERGNYALLTTVAIVPIMGALALAVDYAEMSRQRQETLNALDAAGIATARRIVEGVSDEQAKVYARTFFETNLGSVEPANTSLTVLLPQNNTGGGTLKLTAGLNYKPYFFGAFSRLMGKSASDVNFSASSEIRLKNTLEVALVLDNSGSMTELGHGSSKVRFDLLKDAAKIGRRVGQPGCAHETDQQASAVRGSSVRGLGQCRNGSASKAWMDQQGISPVHHENFPGPLTLAPTRISNASPTGLQEIGTGWPAAEQNQVVNRFTMFDEIKYYTNSAQTLTAPIASWQGCVEARPYPYNVNDAKPSAMSDGIATIRRSRDIVRSDVCSGRGGRCLRLQAA